MADTKYVSNKNSGQAEDRIHGILVSEARAFASMAVLSMQAAALNWGRSTTGNSGDWWIYLIASVIILGIVAWEVFSGKLRGWSRPTLMVVMGLAVVWIMFSIVAIPLSYKTFIVLALVLLAWSLVWVIFLLRRRVPNTVKWLADSTEDGSSIMLSAALMGSAVLAYSRFMDKNIHGWYVETSLILVVMVGLTILFIPKGIGGVSSDSHFRDARCDDNKRPSG